MRLAYTLLRNVSSKEGFRGGHSAHGGDVDG